MLLPPLLFYVTGFSQGGFNEAVEYNAFIVNAQREVVKQNLDYISFSIYSNDYQLIEVKRKEVLKQIRQAKHRIERLPAFKGNNRLKNEAVNVLSEYEIAFEDDFKEVARLGKNSENSFEAMEAYFKAQNKTEERVSKASEKFNKVQDNFVKQHNLTYGDAEDQLTAQMKEVAALNRYIRSIFLEYFRVSKSFARMLEALKIQKSGPLDKERKQVIEQANEATTMLVACGDFNGERDYLDQTINLIEYYRALAENEFLKITGLLDKKNGIDQQDATYINKVLRDYNANIEILLYNLNTSHNNLLQNNIVSTQ
ncbi:MAG: hypothetical protein WD555_01595 [Fulvivirga sp.]